MRKGIVLCVVIALGLLVMEWAARLVYDRNGMHYGVEMWKYAKLIKRRSANLAMSHEHVPGAEGLLMGATVKINSRGLRDREYSLSKDPDDYRILVLGDSMTFGWGVAMEDTYCEVLERMLSDQPAGISGRRVEVVNAGIGNYNTAQEVAYFKQRGVLYEPDMVILGFYINDAEPTPKPSEGLLARHSYLYVLASSAFDGIIRKLGWKESYVEYYRKLYSEESKGWQQCRAAFKELSSLCRQKQIRLLVVLIPELHSPGDGYPFGSLHQAVGQLADKDEIPVLDLQRAFDGIEPRSLWVSRGDAHPNATAHQIIGREIYKRIAASEPGTEDSVVQR